MHPELLPTHSLLPTHPETLELESALAAKDLGPFQPAAHAPSPAVERAPSITRGGARAPPTGGRGRGRGRNDFTNRASKALAEQRITEHALAAADDGEEQEPLVVRATPAPLTHQPSAVERAADPEDLAIIRELYGSRSQTIINALLAFDAYFQWYYPHKRSIPFLAPDPVRQAHALHLCRNAIDMQEAYERVSMRNHGSFLPHGCVFKVPRDILRIANVHALNLSPLELQNSETKITAQRGGSRRLTTSTQGETRRPMRGSHAGPEVLVPTKGYSTSMAISTLKKMMALRYPRRGDGIVALPDSRRKERLFGVSGPGRSSRLLTNVKLEKLRGSNYDPCKDSCIQAFVRLLSASAEADGVGGNSE